MVSAADVLIARQIRSGVAGPAKSAGSTHVCWRMVEMTKEEISELLALIADAKEVNEEGMRAGPIAPQLNVTQARCIYASLPRTR